MKSSNPSPLSVADTQADASIADTLDTRVRSLKISATERVEPANATFPWLIAVVMTVVCGWLAYRDNAIMAMLGLADRDTATEVTPTKKEPSASTGTASTEGNAGAIKTVSTNPASQSGGAGTDASALPSNAIALEARGYVVARHQVLVSPQVNGRILKLNIEEGRRVTKGDVLAEVEKTEYLADVEQMRGTLLRNKAELAELETGARPQEIAGATADLQEQEELLSQLESQHTRLKEALKTNAISLTEYEQAQSSSFSMRRRVEKLRQSLDMMKEGPRKERIEMARAAVVQAEANLVKSQWRLDNCTIRAPISGTILKKNAEEGNLVNPVAFNGSTSVCDIADLSDLEVDLNIQERDIAKVFANQTCEVRAEAFPKRVYKATVSRLMPIADRAKGAVTVRVAIKVPEEEQGVFLKPEMSAIVVFFGSPGS